MIPTTKTRLSQEELKSLFADVWALRQRLMQEVGGADAAYIRRMARWAFWLEVCGRSLLFLGFLPPTWVLGTLLLAASKCIENMEIGHNVMHGQYDWMKDPVLNSQTYEWDIVATASGWKLSHNDHHVNAGIVGKDADIVEGFRLDNTRPWRPRYLAQPALTVLIMLFYQYASEARDCGFGNFLRGKETLKGMLIKLAPLARKAPKQLLKDYVLFPLLAYPNCLAVYCGNLAANGLRNILACMAIFSNHLPSCTEYFDDDPGEDALHRCYRQIATSANFSGGRMLHILTGHLGYHIEHHLFPSMPSSRLPEAAEEVRNICARHHMDYHVAPFWRQAGGVFWRIFRYSLP